MKPCTGEDDWELEQTAYPSLCTTTQHPLINNYSSCPPISSFYFLPTHPLLFSNLALFLRISAPFQLSICLSRFPFGLFTFFFSHPSLYSLFPCPSDCLTFPLYSHPLHPYCSPFPAVSHLSLAPQWLPLRQSNSGSFQHSRCAGWMGGWVEEVEGEQRTGCTLGGERTTYTCMCVRVRNMTRLVFF